MGRPDMSGVLSRTVLTVLLWSVAGALAEVGSGGDEASGGGGGWLSEWVGTSDLVILAVLGLGALWWQFGRAKEEAFAPTIRPVSAPGGGGVDSSSFVAKMKSSGRNVVVFYGSQTGTAEELAGRLAKDATRYGMKGIALDPEECDMDELSSLKDIEPHLAIFCLATYGEGDPTDNAQEMFEFLGRGDADLAGIHYAVFGLGNKTYEHYNEMGIFADKKLEELGANRVAELGLGDDDGNLEEDFMLWRESFWPSVCEKFGIESVGEDISTRQYRLTLHSEESEDMPDPDRIFAGEMGRLRSFANQRPPFDQKNPFLAQVMVNRELHSAQSGRSCRHIELSLEDSKLRYEAGDHAAVYPTNDENIVQGMAKILGVDLSTVFTLTNVDTDSSKKHPFPCPTTFATALRHYVDLTAPVRTHVLKELAEHCSDEEDKALLKLMGSAKEEGRRKYAEWMLADRRTILDVLRDVSSCRPPMDLLCELLPRLQARYYSISSSPKHDPQRLSVTAVVVSYETRLGRRIDGVATTYLQAKDPAAEAKVPIFVRKSGLRLPHRTTTPVIMIGPGTGFAPFRGFIQDRAAVRAGGKETGPMVLYFGCRHSEQDYLYKDEIAAWKADGVLSEVHEAFSRQGPEKVYVQHLLKKNAAATWRLIHESGGHVYVCGDARSMAKDVMAAFVEMARNEGGLSEDQAKAYLKRMESQKRYQADVWS